MMLNNLMAKEQAAATSSSGSSSSAARSYAGSATRLATAAAHTSASSVGSGAATSTSQRSQSRSQQQQQKQQHYAGSSASSVSSSSTVTTNRSASHTHCDVAAEKDRRRAASRAHTSASSSGSSAAASASARTRRRHDDSSSSVSTSRDAAPVVVIATTTTSVDVGPEKFAAKVGGRELIELSSSSSSPGSDKDDASPRQPSKRNAGSVAASNSSSTSSTSTNNSKPSRMIVKRRTLGSSHPASVASTSIPNKYVQQPVPSPPSLVSTSDHNRAGVETTAAAADATPHDRDRSTSTRRVDSSSNASQSQPKSVTPRTLARKVLRPDSDSDAAAGTKTDAAAKPRPVRIKYEAPARGVVGSKREISHASLGKLIARLTDAHQYDTTFRDVFLLTYRSFCAPYDFVKKLRKRYTAVLSLCGGLDADALVETQRVLEQLALDDDLDGDVDDDASGDRSSTLTTISTARSDINTGMEASVSIMRLLSVLKFWIKESGFIEMDLSGDRRTQKKLLAFLAEIQSTSPVPSIRKHAETMLLLVAQLVRSQQQQQQQQHHTAPVVLFQASSAASGSASVPVVPSAASVSTSSHSFPPPPVLVASTSVSSVTDSLSGGTRHERSTEVPHARERGLSAAMSKLKLTRSSSDPKRSERSNVKLKLKQSDSSSGGGPDIFPMRARTGDDSVKLSVGAPKFLRGVTTGSADALGLDTHRFGLSSNSSSTAHDAFHDSMFRSRIAVPRNSARTSYDNVGPLAGLTAQELADQLTLVEAECYFAQVNPRELTNKAWTRAHKHRDAPHVMALIELFDATAEWVSSEILHPRLQAAERAKLLTFFIDAAENCYQLNNFNTLFAVFTGLSAPCVRQLTTTWGLVGASASDKYQFLHGICSTEDNYRNYRQQFGFAEGQPRLPCWFILVKDLFQFEESMKSVDDDGLIHWHKFRRIHRVISEALDRQNVSYLPASGAVATTANGISRKGKGLLRHDRRVQNYVRHRLETVRKDSTVLYQLARNANTQESILFVNSLSEAGFL